MDEDLAVAPRRPGRNLAVEIDGEDVLEGDFVKPDTMRLHEEQRGIVGQPHGNMPARKVVLPLRNQYLAGDDQLRLDFVVGHFESPGAAGAVAWITGPPLGGPV